MKQTTQTYKLHKSYMGEIVSVQCFEKEISIPFDSANADYQTFRQEINEGKAELQDAEGNVMTVEEVEEFVATLPQ